METVFKVGDKVFHHKQGWGIVTDYTQCLMRVEFTKSAQFFEKDDKLLSFTEYTLQGFTQERPINLPEVGELCLVRDDDEDLWVLKCFRGYYPSLEKPFVTSPRNVYYKQIKRIKILD
jgi:hypothetical protein